VAFEHRRRVGQQDGYGVAARDAALGERTGEAAGARVEFGIAPSQWPMDDRDVIGKHRGRARQERQRRERLEIRRIAVEVDIVGGERHGVVIRRIGMAVGDDGAPAKTSPTGMA
jgi:hypothetical protein